MHSYVIVATNLGVLCIAGFLIAREAAMDAKQEAAKKRQLARAQTAAIAAVRQTESRLGASAMGLDDNAVVPLHGRVSSASLRGLGLGSGPIGGSGTLSGSARGVGASRLRHTRMLSAVEEDSDGDGDADGGDAGDNGDGGTRTSDQDAPPPPRML